MTKAKKHPVTHTNVSGSATRTLAHLLAHSELIMATLDELKAELDSVKTKLAANTTATDSILALIKSFPVVAPTDPAALQAAVDEAKALGTDVDANTAKLQQALSENPPA